MNPPTRFTHNLLLAVEVTITCLLSACYAPRQATFDSSVHRSVQINMPVSAAIANLGTLKLVCYRTGTELDCNRQDIGLLLSCIERVVITPSDPNGLVASIDIRKIVCLGGFG